MKLGNKLGSCIEKSINLLFFIRFQFFYLDSYLFFAFLVLNFCFFDRISRIISVTLKISYEFLISKNLSFLFEFHGIVCIFSLFSFLVTLLYSEISSGVV
jgi:hypothetical protein